jgi:hypothetical protein
MLIAYYLGFPNRKPKYFEEKTTATLKNKQTSIAAVLNHFFFNTSQSPDPRHFSLVTTFKFYPNCEKKIGGEDRGKLIEF